MPARITRCARFALRSLRTCTRPRIGAISLYFSQTCHATFLFVVAPPLSLFTAIYQFLFGTESGCLAKAVELFPHEAVTIQFTNDFIKASLCDHNQIVAGPVAQAAVFLLIAAATWFTKFAARINIRQVLSMHTTAVPIGPQRLVRMGADALAQAFHPSPQHNCQ